MQFEHKNSILFSDTSIPDIFITEYMPNVDGDYSKVYLYCLFLSKNNSEISINDLSNRLCIDIAKVKQVFAYWENANVIIRKGNSYILKDLKEIEIHKVYTPKLNTDEIDLAGKNEKNSARIKVIEAINNAFFQGVMSPVWYNNIDDWFSKYKFDEDVMYSLFHHCFDNKALSKNYITAVADNWYSKGIKTISDLDNYFVAYEKLNDIKKKIIKKLGIKNRSLTEYENAYIEKWVMTYEYDFKIIELALKKTTAKTNPNFNYIDTIISQWYKNKLKTVEEIENYSKQFKEAEKLKRESTATTTNATSVKHYNQDRNIDYTQYIANFKENL